MIKTRRCIYCDQVMRANGTYQFREVALTHLVKEHPEKFKELKQKEMNMNQALNELKEMSSEMVLTLGIFRICVERITEKVEQ
jgi:hypothetical protein